MKQGSNSLRLILVATFVFMVALAGVISTSSPAVGKEASSDQYHEWKSLGERAASQALAMIKKKSGAVPFSSKQLIALSNAGYAEVNGETTMAALDGLSKVTNVSRGANTLLEVHSAPDSALWFAVYDKRSGYCAYLQVDPAAVGKTRKTSELFSIRSIEKVKASYLFKNPDNFAPNFGGNEFRIVTIANAVAEGVPSYFVRSFEFHDHYCPGVTSGILMGTYAKAYFAESGVGSYFVQGLQPWCKEDALMVMLNATPGKSGYAATYATTEDRAGWEYPDASSIIYHQNSQTTLWEGLVLGFTFATSTGCEIYTNTTINKLCVDLWYLDHADTPEDFVTPYYKFTLKSGDHPKNHAKPGIDIMENLPSGQKITE